MSDAESRQPHKVAWKRCFCRGERVRTGEEHLQLEYLELGSGKEWASGMCLLHRAGLRAVGMPATRCLYRAGLRGMEQPTDFHSSNPLASPEFVKACDFPRRAVAEAKTEKDAERCSGQLSAASLGFLLRGAPPGAQPVPGAGWQHRFGVSHDLVNRHCD